MEKQIIYYNNKFGFIKVDNQIIWLTTNEAKLMNLFVNAKGKLLKYEDISKNVYNCKLDLSLKNTISQLICRLKKKIKPYLQIVTIYKKGFFITKTLLTTDKNNINIDDDNIIVL